MDPDQLASTLSTRELISAWFHTVFESVNCLSTKRYKLIWTIGQVNFFFGQVIYGHLLVLEQVENFTISTPLPNWILLNLYLLAVTIVICR